ncbi:hypothetical protein AAC387_Pa04g0022 [Persea americana]
MVGIRKPLLTFHSSRQEERLGEGDGSSWFSSKMVSKDSQEEGEGIGVIKAPPFTKKERHTRRERVAGREERKSSFTIQKLQEFGEEGTQRGF